MAKDYIVEEIPEEVVEKYGLRDIPTESVLGGLITITGRPVRITPFTRYEIFEMDDKLFVRIPKRGA